MQAHGYGAAHTGAPTLIFPNIIWGHLVRLIPEVNSVLGSSIAALGVLFVVGAALVHGLLRLGTDYATSLSVMVLGLTFPILFPNFTVNAGLLTVGAIILWRLFAEHDSKAALVMGCLLAFLGFLIRYKEFLFVFLIALPLIPWRVLLVSHFSRTTLAVLAVALAGAAIIDHWTYQTEEWQPYNELQAIRPILMDKGAGSLLLDKYPDILARHGYSTNDINLMMSWFLADPRLADPERLKDMLDELGPLPLQEGRLAKGWASVSGLFHEGLVIVVVTGLLLALLRPSRQVTATWGLSILAFFAVGVFFFRTHALHVNFPVVVLLLIAPLLTGRSNPARFPRIEVLLLAMMAAYNAPHVFADSAEAKVHSDRLRGEMAATFPTDESIVTWGISFLYASACPVLGGAQAVKPYKIHSLGHAILAPGMVPYWEAKNGRGVLDRLFSDDGVPILSSYYEIGLLETYCNERGGRFRQLAEPVMVHRMYNMDVMLYRCQCRITPGTIYLNWDDIFEK